MSDPRETSLSQHLSTLPKLDKTHFVSMFVRDQRVHAKSHVLEGRAVVSHWNRASVVVPNEHKVQAPESDRDAFGTPVLKPRLLSRIIPEATRVPLQDHKNDPGHPKSLKDDRLTHPTEKENKRKRTGSTIATKRSVPKPNRQSRIQDEPPLKEPVSSIDLKDEQASRRRSRRDRKRAKRAIINPTRSSDAENETMENAEASRNAKSNAKAKIPAGFALMHGFTATNVGRSRLTIKPSASIGVFNKGKASVKTLTKHKGAKKGRQSTGFSELGFLNNRDQGKPQFLENSISIHSSSNSDSHSRSSDQSPEERPRKFVITNRRPPKSRRVEAAKTPHCNSPRNLGDSVMSVDGPSISHPRQALSSPNLLHKATPTGSTMWDIEIETASVLSSVPPFEKRSVMLEIRNRRWNDSPENVLARPDFHNGLVASPRPKMSAEKVDNLVEAKSPSPSLGPSQSASQHGRCFRRADDILPQVGGCSRYFISQVTQKEQEATLEKQSVIHTVKVTTPPPKEAEEIRPDVISAWERISEPEPEPLDQRPRTSSPIRSLDKEVAHHGLVPQHYLDLEIAPCLQPSPTEWPAFWSLHPVLSGVEPGNVGPDSRFDSEFAHTAGWNLEQSLDDFTRDRYPSIDYNDDPRHHGRDTPEDLVPCPSYHGYNASMLYLYRADSGGSQEPDCIPEHDLSEISEAEGEYIINPLLSFSENGERELVDEHTAGWDMCPDSNEDPRCGEYFGNEHENLELDDAWNQRHSDIVDESTSSNDLCDSCSGDSIPVYSAAMFSQGRALLMGSTPRDGIMSTGTAVQGRSRPPLSLVEADVAKTLRNHWLPQKL